MIQPWLSRAFASDVDDLRPDLGKGAGHDDLVRHAEIGAPPDPHPRGVQRLERRAAIKHDHHGIGAGWPAASRSRRPVVTRNGSPISLSGSRCAAHSAWIDVTPGTTSISGKGSSRRAIRRLESYSEGSPQISSATRPSLPR